MFNGALAISIKSILDGITADTLTFGKILEIIGLALLFGFILSLLYIFTNRKDGYSKGMAYTLVMLPTVLSIICVVTLNSEISFGGAISIGGALTIIRFRSTQGSPRDLSYIFAALATGLACGLGFVVISALLVTIMAVIMIVLSLINYGVPKYEKKLLKVIIPENLNYVGVFDEIFKKYTNTCSIQKVRSTNFGTMFELCYVITMKSGMNEKEMFDEIRCLNGNLNISLGNFVVDPEAN